MTAVSHYSPMYFAGSQLGEFRHVCAFFSSDDDEYRTMLPFMRDGLALGQRVVSFMPQDRIDHEDRLRAGGIDVDEAERTHQLDVIKSEDAYLVKNGHFDGDAMLQHVPLLLESGHDFGFAITRLIAHAEHMTKDSDDAESFMQYESRLNYLLPKYPDVVVCTYDLNRVGAGVVMDALRTHPMVVIGGVLHQNPFFMPPAEFLREVDGRRAQRDDSRDKPSRKPRSGNGKARRH
jgi:hypothetical protein